MPPFTGLPDPPLDFDDTVELLRALYVGELLTIAAFPNRKGASTMTMHGWSGEVQVYEQCFVVPIGTLTDPPTAKDLIHNELRVFRSQFRRAGELLDADPPGPLGIELVDWNEQADWTLFVSARDVAPDWEAMRAA